MSVRIWGSLPKDTYGINYRGKHSGKDFDMWLTKSPMDFLVESVDSIEDRPVADGMVDFGANLSARAFEFEFVIRAKNEAELRNKRRAIAAWLTPTKGLSTLWWDLEPDKYYTARRYSGAQNIEMEARQGKFTLEMIAPDPFAYDRNEEPVSFTSAGESSIENKGTEVSYPYVEITGTNTSGSIQITLADQLMEYKGSLNDTEKVVIDYDDMTVYKEASNGIRTNELNNTNNNFTTLPMGSSTVKVAVTGDASIGQITIKPRSRWY